MIFWDSSAIVPLLVAEPKTRQMNEIAKRDSDLVVWWASRVECTSALSRIQRDERLPVAEVDNARELLAELSHSWAEVLPSDLLRRRAERLLLRHPIRAADALQLSAAIAWAEGEPEGHRFCTLDDRLTAAARGEGFRLVP